MSRAIVAFVPLVAAFAISALLHLVVFPFLCAFLPHG